MSDMGALLLHRLMAALTTLPAWGAWVQAVGLFLLLAALSALLGWRSGFLRWRPLRAPWPSWVGIVLVSFVTPALAEEAVFRALWIPIPAERASAGEAFFGCLAGLVAFVIYHPLKKRLLPARRNAPFADPTFLFIATLLGIVCTASYVTSGSLWPPVALHWLFVSVWLLLFNGWQKMGQGREPLKSAPKNN